MSSKLVLSLMLSIALSFPGIVSAKAEHYLLGALGGYILNDMFGGREASHSTTNVYNEIVFNTQGIERELNLIAQNIKGVENAIRRQQYTPEWVEFLEREHNLKTYGKYIGIDIRKTQWHQFAEEYDVLALRKLLDNRIARFEANLSQAFVISQILGGKKNIVMSGDKEIKNMVGQIAQKVDYSELMALLESQATGGSEQNGGAEI